MGSNSNTSLLRLISDLELQIKNLSSPPTEFVRFKALPPELRLMVWRHAFPPGRHFEIDNYGPGIYSSSEKYFYIRRHNSTLIQHTPDLPATLYVNHESRHETLRHYQIIFPQDCFSWRFKAKPLCVNPHRDSLHFSFESTRSHIHDFVLWLEFLNSRIPGGLQSFQGLEIRQLTWLDIEKESSEDDGESKLISWILSYFTGIRNLMLTLCCGENDDIATKLWFEAEHFLAYIPVRPWIWAPVSPGYTKDGVLKKIFDVRSPGKGNGNGPEITLRKWQPSVRYTERDSALRSKAQTMDSRTSLENNGADTRFITGQFKPI